MLAKVLKLVAKFGKAAIKWVKNNWKWLVELTITAIIEIVEAIFG